MLIVAAIIFICCWLPHVICFLCLELSAGKVCQCPSSISEYGLLLGEFFLIENLFIEFFLFTSVTFFFFYSFQNICEGSLSLKSHSHFYQLFRSISINFHNYFRNLVSPYIYHSLCMNWNLSSVLSIFSGYSHSAITPIFYWILNHNSLRQSSCLPFMRISAIQRFMRTHLRVRVPPPPPSSTNEAALGAFNPRYIKAKPQQYRPPASSFNLY